MIRELPSEKPKHNKVIYYFQRVSEFENFLQNLDVTNEFVIVTDNYYLYQRGRSLEYCTLHLDDVIDREHVNKWRDYFNHIKSNWAMDFAVADFYVIESIDSALFLAYENSLSRCSYWLLD